MAVENMVSKDTVLYIGGFQLPDKNAAALRVMANAKALRDMGYQVVFLNALPETDRPTIHEVCYEGFKCIEFRREKQIEYLLSCKRVVSFINKINAKVVIAYNYPSVALNKLRRYCKKNSIRCIADVTEWYVPTGNMLFKIFKGLDTEFRMRYVQKNMDGIIAISEYIYQYYRKELHTVKVPPLVDIHEEKWNKEELVNDNHDIINLIYAGSPSVQKERLDIIVNTVEKCAADTPIKLKVVGLTQEQYESMYGCSYKGNSVKFLGRVSNTEVINMTKCADWTVILRENNKVVRAGFPTKVAESISCGTPVIANRFSNIEDYLNESNSILINDINDFKSAIRQLKDKIYMVDRTIFDYSGYKENMYEIVNCKGGIFR